jgi:hypothetical protein
LNYFSSGDGAPISKSGGGRSSSSKLIRRGHAKTKSLDYKYMLSQLPNQQSSSTTASQNAQNSSLTAGAKSNSLTRGAFPNELLLTTTTNGGGGLENAEENAAERINNAKGVVQQIITKELEFESSSSRESEKADEQRQKAAVCSSTSNSLRHTASGRDDSNSRSPELVAEAEEDELVPPLPFSPLPHPQLSPRHHHPGGGQIFHTPASYRLPTTNTNELEILGEECSSVSSSATREVYFIFS